MDGYSINTLTFFRKKLLEDKEHGKELCHYAYHFFKYSFA